MFKKIAIAVFTVAAIGILSPSVAEARGGMGFRGGGFHGGFHHHGFGRIGLGAVGLGLGLGLAAAPYGYGYPYGYGSYATYGGDCYLLRRRVWTPFGWRLRRIEVCD